MMKKTLALLLALLMILSVAFVSCGDEEVEEPDQTEDDFGFDFPDAGDGSNKATSNGTGSSASGFSPITENTTAYMLMSVNVKQNAKKSAATNGSVLYGKSVTRVEANSTWTKIKYTDSTTGASKEGYVYNEVLTTDIGRVTYVAKETPVVATSLHDKVTVRKAPWIGIDEYSTVIDQISNGSSGVAGEEFKLKKDQAVEILGETQSADDSGSKWAYIKYTVSGTAVYGWCRCDMLNTGTSAETPDTPADPSTPVVPNPV